MKKGIVCTALRSHSQRASLRPRRSETSIEVSESAVLLDTR
jgi:hypothetical protein